MGALPRRSGSERGEGSGQAAEEVGLRAAGGQSETDAACGFDDAGGDLDQPCKVENSVWASRAVLGWRRER